jgi:hypothetical protein
MGRRALRPNESEQLPGTAVRRSRILQGRAGAGEAVERMDTLLGDPPSDVQERP